MTSDPAPRNAGLKSGWILVTGLLTLCVLGTWLTARNYRQQVFCSTSAVVLENQWPESRISATFAADVASHFRVGQVAKITLGRDKKLISGRVVSIGSGTNASVIMIAVTGDGEDSPGASDKALHHLPSAAPCSVTVDTSIPVDAVAVPTPKH